MAEPAYAPLAEDLIAATEDERRQHAASLEQWIQDSDRLLWDLEERTAAGVKEPTESQLREVHRLRKWLSDDLGVRTEPLEGFVASIEGRPHQASECFRIIDYIFDVLQDSAFCLKHPERESARQQDKKDNEGDAPPDFHLRIMQTLREHPGLSAYELSYRFASQLRPNIDRCLSELLADGSIIVKSVHRPRANHAVSIYRVAEGK